MAGTSYEPDQHTMEHTMKTCAGERFTGEVAWIKLHSCQGEEVSRSEIISIVSNMGNLLILKCYE